MFNWRQVRSLGELQVLTRASYLLLVVVPLLAALWSGVRLAINQYNHAVYKAINLLEIASNELRQESLKIQSVLESANSENNNIATKVGEKTLDILQNLKKQSR
jgi:hypothetical protein